MIYRYSSRLKKLSTSFLNEKLKNAVSYDRIAGYFSTSIMEIAGEAIENIKDKVRIVCNSNFSSEDAKSINAVNYAIRMEWCENNPEELFTKSPERLKKLYKLLSEGKLIVKIIPNDLFGLIHGKAGVITLENGSKTSFLGSINETYSGWNLNYELLWEDDSEEAVRWVQDEFDFFWNNPNSFYLTDFVIKDIERLSKREVIPDVNKWKEKPDPGATIVELPVNRKSYGLWEHQKYFANIAFEDHKKEYGARYVLADSVGLGKTISLGVGAQLAALYGEKPIIIIVPKTLIWQWQDELYNFLDMPCAVWDGKDWVDENKIRYPSRDPSFIKKCPRKIGIISQGLITAKSAIVDYLKSMEFEMVIVDEAHRARRKNLSEGHENRKPDPNNLMEFCLYISNRTKSMLLSTATPVQLNPIEAWDLLNILSQKNDSVLGDRYSMWRKNPKYALELIMGNSKFDYKDSDFFEWLRNPFPPAKEDATTFGIIRNRTGLKENEFVLKPETYENLSLPDKTKIKRIFENDFFKNNNPFIRHIVRRDREYLEKTINVETGEPYLKKIDIKLYGESNEDAILMTPYLKSAYNTAEEFAKLMKERFRGKNSYLKTILLRRLGSSMIAGYKTALNLLKKWSVISEENENNFQFFEEDEIEEVEIKEEVSLLNDAEIELLHQFIKILDANKEDDPKLKKILYILKDLRWAEKGVIIFSQYFDSSDWIARSISEEFQDINIGLYAGGDKSGIYFNGIFEKHSKEKIKAMVKNKKIKILVGTDAASEGLNLQTLNSLINLDLPWNPTRLEQRKGRIQRIGQIADEILIYNLRYKDSIEDRVHELLSKRLESIYNIFGQIPDYLEDVWVDVVENDIEKAKKLIDEVPKRNPFEIKYQQNVKPINWESCEKVLNKYERKKYLMQGW